MTAEREVHYADSGDLQIAYKVTGDGPVDVVFSFDMGSNLDIMGEDPLIDQFLRRFGEYGRLIYIDPRGVGLSDPLERVPTLEELVDDVRAVLRDVGAEHAALVGHGFAAQQFMLFAAMHPNLTSVLVTVNGYARLRRAPDYPCGLPPETEAFTADLYATQWGTGGGLALINPSYAEQPRTRAWLARMERGSATPRRALRRQEVILDIDVRDVLATINTPTLVIQSDGDRYVRPGHAQYLVEHIAGAQMLKVASDDHVPLATVAQVEIVADAIEKFLTGTAHRPATQRSLMSVAFTDIVDSTNKAAELGDKRWRSLLEAHERVAHREVEEAGGRLIKFTGDGLLATFDGPARAVHCMKSLGEALQPLGLPIRAGVHTGEAESIGDDIGGLAVHIAARIAAKAGAGEVLTSSTVRDLVAGSGLEFDDRGEHELKGVPGTWRVLAVR